MSTPYLETMPHIFASFSYGLMFTILLIEAPRYLLLAFAALVSRTDRYARGPEKPPYSLVIVGHNEQATLRQRIEALSEQSHCPDEIIVVSDGSTDAMEKDLIRMQRSGLIDGFQHLELRGGKSAGTNLAIQGCRNEYVVLADSDTEFERHALRNIVTRLHYSDCAAVCGNIRAANADEGLIPAMQDIEYLICISAGKTGLDMLGQVGLVSGAFGAYRLSALKRIGGLDPIGGEDLDLTLRLRRAGYGICFARDAVCLTHVPATAKALIKQRYRWERDAFNLRFRAHVMALNPFSAHFRARELFSFFDFVLFEFLPTMITPFFFIYMYAYLGREVWSLLFTYFTVYGLTYVITFLALGISEPNIGSKPLSRLPAFIVYHMIFLRCLRFLAFVSEWFFHASQNDDYFPEKVRREVRELSRSA
ncbi:MAG: glycosyltransferase [Hyphomicrobiaceae bacterium]